LIAAIQKQLTVWRYVANGIIANAMPCSQNRDLKCNRICKLPVSLSCWGTFDDPYSSFLNYQFLHYLVHIMFDIALLRIVHGK